LWADLEERSGRSLLRSTGGIMIGAPSSELVKGSLESARVHGLRHEMLEAADIRRRFPVFAPDDEMVGVYEPRAGVLNPEQCVTTHLELAAQAGADLRHGEPVAGWRATEGGVEVETPRGRHTAGRLVIAAGPWAPVVLAGLGLPLVIERQVIGWFAPVARGDAFAPGRCPIHLWHVGTRMFYGFPQLDGRGVKIAEHAAGDPTTAETIDRTVAPREIAEIREFIARFIPAANGGILATSTCMYTMTPDAHFVIDGHPRFPPVVIACGFSGHGFKFIPVVGEILADLVTEGRTRHDIQLFSIARFVTAA
jgi:sarcosine oxidase